jgi:hypothetical protein
LFSGINDISDFTPEMIERFSKALDSIETQFISKGTAKGFGFGSAFNKAIDSNDPYAMAYAQSVRERWSGRLPEFAETSEYRDVQDYINEKGYDGLDQSETRELYRIAETEKYNFSGDKLNLITRIAEPDQYSGTQNQFFDILAGGMLPFQQIMQTVNRVNEEKGEYGDYISNNELQAIVQALKEMIPAIKEASTVEVIMKGN